MRTEEKGLGGKKRGVRYVDVGDFAHKMRELM